MILPMMAFPTMSTRVVATIHPLRPPTTNQQRPQQTTNPEHILQLCPLLCILLAEKGTVNPSPKAKVNPRAKEKAREEKAKERAREMEEGVVEVEVLLKVSTLDKCKWKKMVWTLTG